MPRSYMQALNDDGEEQHRQGNIRQIPAAPLFHDNWIGEHDGYC